MTIGTTKVPLATYKPQKTKPSAPVTGDSRRGDTNCIRAHARRPSGERHPGSSRMADAGIEIYKLRKNEPITLVRYMFAAPRFSRIEGRIIRRGSSL
jgi:hypothetical protein